jgi:hypothetical protein
MVGFSSTIESLESKFQIRDGRSAHSLYKPLYEISNMWLSNGFSVLYGAETFTDGSGVERVIQDIENVSTSHQARDSISKGFLTVVNSDRIYESCGADYEALVKFWNTGSLEASQRTEGTSKGTILISSPNSYFKNDQHHTFMMFEDAMGKTFSTSTIMICWYTRNWLSNLSLASLIKILTTHKCTIHNGWRYKEWTENEIISVVRDGIDMELGPGSTVLLFQTLKTIHKLDQDAIVTRPIVFEGSLQRVLGEDSAKAVIDCIFQQFSERISFVGNGDSTG